MADPFKTLVEMQTAMFEAWSNSARHVFLYWKHWVEVQEHFVSKAVYHRTRVEIARGPSFTDKYGKRAHDIDPEKDV
ncbi:MAG: hypothetical protein HYU60_06830 [Magnetospirillum sp.]|nr:hypothetical protein [Magnetospirillum sp.]